MLPALSTARLLLEPATMADLDPIWTIWRDPDVRRYLFDDQPVSRERAAAILDDSLALAADGLGLWLVRGRAAPEIVGCMGLLRVTTSARYDPSLTGAIEPLAVLAPRVWRRCYACEALRAVIHYAFASLGLTELAAVNDVPNEASHRLVERLGFRLIGECDGPCYRMRTYRLTAQAFSQTWPGASSRLHDAPR
jgi:[ribosomal protein S5]-alanine N-acetyltransferase